MCGKKINSGPRLDFENRGARAHHDEARRGWRAAEEEEEEHV
jgi:hypothetical protein